MSDRRRVNGPASGTSIPTFTSSSEEKQNVRRTRNPNQLRKIYLETGVVPTASGSAYLELEAAQWPFQQIDSAFSSLKLSVAVHGPKPLSRNSNFSSNLQLTVNVKFASFATRRRRGYIRDATERDIATQLETALDGVIIPDRWPKSAIDIVITILEAEDEIIDGLAGVAKGGFEGLAYMNTVSGCITAASAALMDAQIDCLDLVTGGVAVTGVNEDGTTLRLLDPSPSEKLSIHSACLVGYMPTRDEITLTWAKGDIPSKPDRLKGGFDNLLDSAVNAAKGAHVVLNQVATELGQASAKQSTKDASKP